MRRHAVAIALCFWVLGEMTAQEAAKTCPDFKLLRSEEDFSFLKNSLPADGFVKKIKYIPLGKSNFLSLGGDVRSEFQLLRNEEWENGNDDAALFQRFMLHTDWHFGKKLRLFGQLKSGFAPGRNGAPSALDRDGFDLHQLFASFGFKNSALEIGRQELRYGSRRLVDVREGTNVRQSFDGARWVWQKTSKRLDLLFYAWNPQRTGVFDNKINTEQLLWGAYFVWNVPGKQGLNFDFYYLGVDNEHPRFEEGSRHERRHSFGLRHWGTAGNFKYNNEAVFQTGTFGNGNITAWTVSTEVYLTLAGKTKPTPGLKAEIISGDKNAGDGSLQTFNPLYPRGGYFGLLALIGPANLMDLHPSTSLGFGEKWSLNLDWDFFWRHRLGDGIYFPSGRLHIEGNGSDERFIGHQPGVQLTFVANRFLELEASWFRFFTGGFLKEVTEGVDFTQTGFSAYLKF